MMHANNGQVTPETQAIDVFKTVSQAQADIASVRALLEICIDYYDDRPATEPLWGCIKLLRTISEDLEPLYDVDHLSNGGAA